MRIAVFSECYLPVMNGVVTSIVTLRAALRAQGHTVYVFAPGSPQPDDDAEVIRLPELPFPRHPYHFARPFLKLGFDFRDLGVDIVHCQHPFTVGHLGADTARRYGLPMVYTAHSLYDTMIGTSKSRLVRTMGQRAVRGVVRRFCARADYVITPSNYTRDWLRDDSVSARFVVVPSGTDGPSIVPGLREEIRNQLRLRQDAPLLLYVGRLGPEKRLDVLLRAAEMLKRRSLPTPGCDFQLVLVGDGQSRAELTEYAAQLGIADRVHFVGAKPHETIGAWYAAADIFAFPSALETQGMVLIEAMTAGLPCVAVDRGGPREIVVHRETGLRVGLDAGAFARGVESLIRDPEERRRLGANAKVRALAYSPEAMASGVMSVYEAALKLPRPLAGAGRLKKSLAEIQRRRRERVKRARLRPIARFGNRTRKR